MQTLSMKLLLNLIDRVLARCSRAEAARILMSVLETGVDKLGVLYHIYEDLMRITDGTKPPEGDELSVFSSSEHLKPVETIAYLVENPEVVLRGSSFTKLLPEYVSYRVQQMLGNCTLRFQGRSGRIGKGRRPCSRCRNDGSCF